MSLLNAILEIVESLPNERVEFPDELVEVAKSQKFLPAALDSGGGFGIRPSGEIVSYTWDDLVNSITVEADARIRNVVLFAAAKDFPRLRKYVPQRPKGAQTCPHCGGGGLVKSLPSDLRTEVVCYCGGVGWIPEGCPDGLGE